MILGKCQKQQQVKQLSKKTLFFEVDTNINSKTVCGNQMQNRDSHS